MQLWELHSFIQAISIKYLQNKSFVTAISHLLQILSAASELHENRQILISNQYLYSLLI